MTIRTFLVAVMMMVLAAMNGYLVTVEKICPSEQKARHLAVREDPLFAMEYTRGNREANLKAFGLDEAMTKRVLDRMTDMDDRHKEKMGLLLTTADDPNQLADSICGQTVQVSPRYGALRYLIVEDRGQRDPIKIDRVSGLERQDWATLSPIGDVFAHVELAEDRQPDATLMAVAGILLAKEQDVLQSYAPWGRGLVETWSWKKVKKENPGIEERVLEYFALMHLFVELATAEGGVCVE